MTPATNERPTVRGMRTRCGDYLVCTLSRDTITLRPLGYRKGGASEVSIPAGTLWQRLMLARPKRKGGKR